jgi:uncharacterized protein
MNRPLACCLLAAALLSAGNPAAIAEPPETPPGLSDPWLPDWRSWFGPRDKPATPTTMSLQSAVARGDPDEVQRMLDVGISPNGLGDARVTPLQIAVMNGRSDLARMLLEQGADPGLSARDSPETPLHLAVRERDEPMARLLLEYGAPLEASVSRAMGTPFDQLGDTPLHVAAETGRPV